MDPLPGLATEEDILRIDALEDRLCELVQGVLIEKTLGYIESRVAAVLAYFLERFRDQSDLGIVCGANGPVRLMPELVRIPDVSFVSWKKLPGRELPAEAIPDLVPNLAVEVLSEGNTPREMQLKLREYFPRACAWSGSSIRRRNPRRRTSHGRKKRCLVPTTSCKAGWCFPDFGCLLPPYLPARAANANRG